MAVALCERGLYPWSDFQRHLITQIAAAEQKEISPEIRPTYYECWLAALESLLIDKKILVKKKIDNRAIWLARAACWIGFALVYANGMGYGGRGGRQLRMKNEELRVKNTKGNVDVPRDA